MCIESRFSEVIVAGLKAWFDAHQTVRSPMIRWTHDDQIAPLLALKKDHDFVLCTSILDGETDLAGRSHQWIETLHRRAYETHRTAVEEYAFKPGEVVLDFKILPLASDVSDHPDQPSHTHVVLEAMKRVKQDRRMDGVHCTLDAVAEKGPIDLRIPVESAGSPQRDRSRQPTVK